MSASEHCEDVCNPLECASVSSDEVSALKTLYDRILDDKGPCEMPTLNCSGNKKPAPATSAAQAFDRGKTCSKEPSVLKRFESNLTLLLDSQEKNDEKMPPLPGGDPALFDGCERTPAGSVNASVFGLDIERAVLGTPAEIDQLLEAANELVMAEALCKHSGAVRAAEDAARAQPESKYAEDAARIGAKTYKAAVSGKKPGTRFMGETPIEVVGYVGCTKPPADKSEENV